MRRPVDLREDAPAEEAAVMRLRATLTCEPPNDHLHNFRGRVIIAAEGGHRARALCRPYLRKLRANVTSPVSTDSSCHGCRCIDSILMKVGRYNR